MPPEIPILSKTTNFFRLYHHVCGKSEVPEIYHFWSCVALISAVLEDRCWVEIYKDEPLQPNLFICLVGPGSVGKGLAISHAVRLVERSVQIQVYRGKVTYAHLIDRLGKPFIDEWGRKCLANPRLWLVMDELKNGVGSNRTLNEEFVALMTEIYTATNYPLTTGTRSHGEITVIRPNLNWLFGSNEAWLRQILTKDIYESGFVARTIFVFADYDLSKRVPRIIYPPDHAEVYDHLMSRLWAMQCLSGRFPLTPTAEAELDRWYNDRKAPEDETMLSAWGRHKELLLRFALINCVADGSYQVIQHGHIVRAIGMVNQVAKFTERLLEAAVETYDSRPVNDTGKYIQKKGKIGHSTLLRYMRAKKAYTAERLKRAVADLKAEGRIEIGRTETGGMFYSWKGD